MAIDVHWHHVPIPFIEAVAAGRCPLAGRVEMDGTEPLIVLDDGFRQALPARLTDPDAAIAAMDAAGLDIVTPSLAPPLMQYEAEASAAIEVSRAVNDGLARLIEPYHGRLRPLANVPLQDPAAAVEELRRSIEGLGLSGVAIGTNVNGRNLGDDEFRPFWRAVAELDVFVFLHPRTPLGGMDRLSRHNLSNFVGLPIDTAAAVASLMFDGVYEEVGHIKTCFAHGGGAFPYLVSRWEHGYRARLEPNRPSVKNPYAYLDSVYCDSLTHSASALTFLLDVVGSDHVCLGSDYPFDMGEPEPVGSLEAAIPDEPTRWQVGEGTAQHLLGIKGRKLSGV